MKKAINPIREFFSSQNITGWVLFLFTVYIILIIKLITLKFINQTLFFGVYSITVSTYILSRFLIGFFYKENPASLKDEELPTVTFGIPAKNEEENIRKTIQKICSSDYPKNKFNVIAVNDGSTDKTLQEMLLAQKEAKKKGIAVEVVNWKTNKGKRDGMAECVKRSQNDLIIFIDSDSFVEKNTAKELVKYFVDDKIAAVAGHAFVANENDNFLTKMQAVKYFVAFKAYKAAESIFGSVTCCSGCCSAYKRKYVLEVIDDWLNQYFLGVRSTYGDDRSLTNFLLEKKYRTLYAPTAIVYTVVPNTFRKFMKQQLRWKKSWIREGLKASKFIWKRNLLMSLAFYTGFLLPFLAPVIVLRAMVWYPLATDKPPLFYLFGLFLMAVAYGLFYYIHTKENKWVFGIMFATLYTLLLVWQLPYAILNIRDTRWGTR